MSAQKCRCYLIFNTFCFETLRDTQAHCMLCATQDIIYFVHNFMFVAIA